MGLRDLDRALSLLISGGIVVVGISVTAYAVAVPWGWASLGVLAIIIGLISLHAAVSPAD
jgi:hypothetical protein